VPGFQKRKEESAKRGKLRGIGYACYIEACGIAPSNVAGSLGARAGLFEAGEIRVHPTGTVTVFTGSHAHGQGHETTFAQVVADRLGLPLEAVEIVHGDTSKVLFGMGTYGSRSMAVGGGALALTADKVIEKGKKIAAHLLEASEQDVVFEDATFKVAGTDKQVPWGQVALSAYIPGKYPLDRLEPGLEETTFYDPPNFTFPNGVFVCEVEIDRDTGQVQLDRLVGVYDAGRVINPMIVDGQIHGGVAQAVGQALMEQTAYDPASGQLLSGSYMDYCLPHAADLPSFALASNEVPCKHNPLGVKGAGEAGATGAPAAVINAVIDALAPLGVTSIDMPRPPRRCGA
jgi:aerobic carbon-monoxide dehydrogenase large subunit